MSKNILVIGESCKDYFVYGECVRLCPAAPAPVFNPIETIENPGMAKNVHRNIKKLYNGCDIFTNSNWEQISKSRYVHKGTNQLLLRVDINDDKVERCDVSKMEISKYEIIVISDYCKGFLLEEDIQYISNNHGCVFLDTKKRLGSWCDAVSYIKINNYEYEKTKYDISNKIKDKLIITQGLQGCSFKGTNFPVKEVQIKDLSGAGDTFLAGLVVKFLNTRDISESITFANQCATKAVQKRGVSIL